MTSNFYFLKDISPQLYQIAVSAERNLHNDPHTTLFKVRLLSEEIVKYIAALVKLDTNQSTFDLLKQLGNMGLLKDERLQIFHALRKLGNKAAHGFYNNKESASSALQIAHKASVIFYRAQTRNRYFNPEPYLEPQPEPAVDQAEVIELKKIIEALQSKAEKSDTALQEKEGTLIQLQGQISALQSTKEETKEQADARIKALEEELDAARRAAEQLPETEQKQQDKERAEILRTSRVELTEQETRFIIDQQLREAGWEVDSTDLTFAKGARPEPEKYKAISECFVDGANKHRADYVLFIGMTPVGIVEAKKWDENVAGAISQAERYSQHFEFKGDISAPYDLIGRSSPWSGCEGEQSYHIPFLYSCNGKEYVRQNESFSGTWFRDCRLSGNTKRPLQGFHSPAGLLDLLKRDKIKAEQKLKTEPFSYLGLRSYQQKAVQTVEEVLEQNQRNCLLAMATGTGKTMTIIGLLYRFIKSGRFKRILFLVDRTALGEQATGKFDTVRLEQNQSLSQIYDVKEITDALPEAETRVHVATVQAMVRRLFDEKDDKGKPQQPINIDQYDCIIVDEAHRGYTLDQEMNEGEMIVRDQSQFLSSYRRVLDYFDAIKIGLTATPAIHTSEIFGKPVYTYSYREAVAEDWLIDHEAPIRYKTLLTENGINYGKGDKIDVFNNRTGEVKDAELEDELSFNVEHFNNKVINENFDRVICEQLAKDLDPLSQEKTMIFCVTDEHADRVERMLLKAFQDVHGKDKIPAKAVKKITGKTDKVAQALKEYQNERWPNVAITVDLLTTGIDVPAICNLVFLRRVKSRILYEQMIGRATRRCDKIGKTVFRIYDPVGIYDALESVSTMKPVVKRPNITIEQLIEEVSDSRNLEVAGSQEGRSFAHDALDELSQKVMRVMRKAEAQAEKNPQLREELNNLEQHWGMPAKSLHQHLYKVGPAAAAAFLKQHSNIASRLATVSDMLSRKNTMVISDHHDEIREVEQTYGSNQRPEDYLSSFDDFIRNNINEFTALSVVVNKPKDLTREQLKEIRLTLDNAGYKEVDLEAAWRNSPERNNGTNKEIAASIIGHIRRAALGEALKPYDQRIDEAMEKIKQFAEWDKGQLKWLNRIANQLKIELVLDDDYFEDVFDGKDELDDILDGELDNVMDHFTQYIWDEENQVKG